MSATDRDALVSLFHSTGGTSWKKNNWYTTAELSTWYGIKVDGQGRVVELRLIWNNLRGFIPTELGPLAKLERLYLGHNQLTGSIPRELGTLLKVSSLYLNENNLTGSIPKELGALTRLESLNLGDNQLMGSIPNELGSLTKLVSLNFGNNQLTGFIPKELGALTNLESFNLGYNQLMGSIPTELGALTRLEVLDLGHNQLTGSIPKELGTLTNVSRLDLSWNNLAGSIPTELGALTKVRVLVLSNNQLTGSIAKELGTLTKISSLYLGRNNLAGSIPKELGALTKLETLDLRYNQLTGSVPKELGTLADISSLDLGWNNLTGTLPPTSYGRDMRDWARIPDENEKSQVRAAGATEAGAQQPWIVRVVGNITDFWHVAVPVVDDVTDVLLLRSTADASSPFWWICLVALVVADIERLWLLFTLCLTVPLLPLLWCWDLCVNTHWRTPARFFAQLNCRGDAPEGTFVGRLLDSVLWVLVGSRSRCSPFWRMIGMSLDAKIEEADHAGVGFGAIDKWVAQHPFRCLGRVLFGSGFVLKGESEGVSRRAMVMIRAVGETLVVDILFLALSVMSGGWDDEISGVAEISALFSILELVTELQYYVAEAGASMEPVSTSRDHAV